MNDEAKSKELSEKMMAILEQYFVNMEKIKNDTLQAMESAKKVALGNMEAGERAAENPEGQLEEGLKEVEATEEAPAEGESPDSSPQTPEA